jgi:hypothetical protein
LNLSGLLSGLAGTRTDGANSPIGERDGLVAKLLKLHGLKHLVGIHCTAHRLNVTLFSSMKIGQYLDEVDHMLATRYKFYRKFPKIMRQLHN